MLCKQTAAGSIPAFSRKSAGGRKTREETDMVKKHHEDLTKALAKMELEDWDKALEMLAIEKLGAGDTYFHEQFNEDEVELMVQNIKDDFPIFHETDVEKAMEKGKQVGELELEIKVLRDKVDEALTVNMAFQKAAAEFRERMARAFVVVREPPAALSGTDQFDFMESIIRNTLKEFSMAEVVTAKAAAGVALTDEEVKFLRENLAK